MRITLNVAGEEYKLRCKLPDEKALAIQGKVQSLLDAYSRRGLAPVQLAIMAALHLAEEMVDLEREYEQVLEFVTAKENS
ncbi:MAG: cell division protein ZapA [Firmicutes bacterium]|nr:cell division protein ZapA [Bacillota bacterium]HOB22528.1 cell division protein ZapA [Bacillota bacterium]HQD38966.1 cell division protein ZapA [Bacillota bacterium]